MYCGTCHACAVDHGPLNSWKRGRFWCFQQSHAKAHGGVSHGAGFHDGDAKYVFSSPEEDGAVTTIRNNYFRQKPLGYLVGINLDASSSHYHIYNNLCAGGAVNLETVITVPLRTRFSLALQIRRW